MRYLYLACIFLLTLVFPLKTHAYELKVSPDVSISQNYVSDSNLYLASLHTWFDSNNYQKDIVSASINQTIGGSVFGDSTLVGKIVSLIGESSGDVRIIADTVYLSGVTNEDLIIIARHVIIDQKSVIKGDALVLAHTVDFSGQLLGKAQITASRINIAGIITGQTTLTGTKIIFNPGTKITNNLSYFSPQRAIVNQGAEIQKELNFNQIESIKQNNVIKRIFFGFISFWAIIKLIATLFVIFILTHLFRVPTQRILEGIQNNFFKNIFIGIAGVIGLPLLSIILFGSLVLIPVSLIVISIYMIIIMILPSMSAIILAMYYQKYIQKQNKISVEFNIAALATIVVTFFGFTPYIGDIVVYILYILSFGAIIHYLYELVRRKKIHF